MELEICIQTAATIFCSFLASAGFWAWLQKRSDKKDLQSKMLIGLAHDRIVFLGMSYIERGYITKDEYEDLNDYLYEPYKALGGNGSAKRVMDEVEKLEIRKSIKKEDESNEIDRQAV